VTPPTPRAKRKAAPGRLILCPLPEAGDGEPLRLRAGRQRHRAQDLVEGAARQIAVDDQSSFTGRGGVESQAEARLGAHRGVNIEYIVCPESIQDKLETRHRVTVPEARETLLSHPRIRFAEKGYVEDEDVYAAFGQTFSGRYLAVFFVYKAATKTAVVISARDMTRKERRTYGRR
jgi:uncharacterized DUF497 family protein